MHSSKIVICQFVELDIFPFNIDNIIPYSKIPKFWITCFQNQVTSIMCKQIYERSIE